MSENSYSPVESKNPIGQSDCMIFQTLISQNYLRYKVHFLHIIRYPWKVQFHHVIFVGCSQARLGMPKVL